jgi:predicted nucleic acid-binding protein
MVFIVDASYLIWSIEGPSGSDVPERERQRAYLARAGLAAPSHLPYELGSALRKDWLRARVGDRIQLHEALTADVALEALEPRDVALVHELADRRSLSFYDAAYLHVCSKNADRTLLTQDRRLREAAAAELGPSRALDGDALRPLLGARS